jgi:hypothetical protein
MDFKEKVKQFAKGRIEYSYVYPDGRWEPIGGQHNLVTNQGSDILAKALAGQLSVNGMYMVFRNDVGATPIVADVTNTADTYATSSANRSFCRVTAMGSPVFTTSDAAYVNNEVAFLAVTDGVSFFPAVPVTDGTSVFYHSALVAIPDFDTQDDDQIFSCSDLSTAITKIAGAQIGIRWTITFETP